MIQLKLNRLDFSKTLYNAGSMAGKSKSLPILDYIKFNVNKDILTMTSYDGETAVKYKCPVVYSSEDSGFCINAKELIDCVKVLTNDVITLEINDDVTLCTIKYDTGYMTINACRSDQYPVLKKESTDYNIEIQSDILSEWLKSARKFIANDPLRPVLSCIHIYVKDGNIGYCATDGHRLINEYIPYNQSDIDTYLNIRFTSFKPILDICSNSGSITMTVSNQYVTFTGEDCAVFCRKTEGAYPNFRSIIPNNYQKQATISTQDLEAAIKRAGIIVDKSTNLLKLTFNNNQVELFAKDIDFNKSGKEIVSCEWGNDEISIGLKTSYLLTCLSCVNTITTIIEVLDNTRLVLIKEPNNVNKVILLMPMILG